MKNYKEIETHIKALEEFKASLEIYSKTEYAKAKQQADDFMRALALGQGLAYKNAAEWLEYRIMALRLYAKSKRGSK